MATSTVSVLLAAMAARLSKPAQQVGGLAMDLRQRLDALVFTISVARQLVELRHTMAVPVSFQCQGLIELAL